MTASIMLLSIVVAVGCVSIRDSVFPFTEGLAHGDTTIGDVANNYTVEFYKDEHEPEVAIAHVRVGQAINNQHSILVEIWHESNTIVYSLCLEFNTDQLLPDMSLRGAESIVVWTPLEYHQTDDGKGIRLDVSDLGFQGKGIINLAFYLGPRPPPPDQLNLDVFFSIHKDGTLKLTRQEARLTI